MLNKSLGTNPIFQYFTEIANEIKGFGQTTSQLFESLHTSSKSDLVNSQIDSLKEKLFTITNMVGDLTNNNDDIEKLGDLVEKELTRMDKAIEEVSRSAVKEVQLNLIFS
jgi:huntingtin interacting protein 1